ncbi:MAG: exodeoxyribonuclease VII small subunit [Nitrospirae bacterium]|nr:exodeoxyribonuclease VII small subunit [Nitrospirota bacterium]
MAAGKFEEALGRLEGIVRALEQGDLSLEDSLKRFEEGIRLSKQCMKMLEEAERKVEILVTDKDGKKRLQPFSDRPGRGRPGDGFEGDEDDDEDDEEDSGGDDDEDETDGVDDEDDSDGDTVGDRRKQ